MRDAAIYAATAGIRTAAQTAAGMLGALVVFDVGDLAGMNEALIVAGIAAVLSGVAAFLQNFAEMLNLPGEEDDAA